MHGSFIYAQGPYLVNDDSLTDQCTNQSLNEENVWGQSCVGMLY